MTVPPENFLEILNGLATKEGQIQLQNEFGELKAIVKELRADLVAKEKKITDLEEKVIQQGQELLQLRAQLAKSPEPPPKQLVDLVLAGDSIIKHVDVVEINQGGRNVKICTLGGGIADVGLKIMNGVSKYDVQEVVIQLGSTNAETENPSRVVNQLAALAEDIKIESPTKKVFIGDILPRLLNGESNTDFEVFRQIHRKLRGASKAGHFTMITNYQFWRKSGESYTQNYKCFTKKDLIHLNFRGVELLTSNFMFRHLSCDTWQNPYCALPVNPATQNPADQLPEMIDDADDEVQVRESLLNLVKTITS